MATQSNETLIQHIIISNLTGFVNPIATGLTEEQMAPELPKKDPRGFENPLFANKDDKVWATLNPKRVLLVVKKSNDSLKMESVIIESANLKNYKRVLHSMIHVILG